MQISHNQYLENFFQDVRQKLNRPEGDQLLYREINPLIWGFLCQQRLKHQFILGKITVRIWLRTSIPQRQVRQPRMRHVAPDDKIPFGAQR